MSQGMRRLTNEQIANALEATNGYVYLAARSLHCAPKTIYLRLKKSPALKQRLDDIRGEELDLTEQKLRDAILRGEAWAITLKLKTLGKSRGYVERQEVTGADGGKVQIEYVNDWRGEE